MKELISWCPCKVKQEECWTWKKCDLKKVELEMSAAKKRVT